MVRISGLFSLGPGGSVDTILETAKVRFCWGALWLLILEKEAAATASGSVFVVSGKSLPSHNAGWVGVIEKY